MGKCLYCGKNDYLGKRCRYCGEYVCSDHILPEKHDCEWLKEKKKDSLYRKALEDLEKLEGRESEVYEKSLHKFYEILSKKDYILLPEYGKNLYNYVLERIERKERDRGFTQEITRETQIAIPSKTKLLIEIEDALEMREALALLEPSLFQDTNKISLPRQVNPLTEDNLRNALWYALEEFEVYGEVNLGEGFGRIDLLCDDSGVRVGIECKDEFLKNIGKKDFDYARSSALNALYFASFAIGDYEFSLDYIEAMIMDKEPILETLRKYTFIKEADKMRGRTYEDVIYHLVGEASEEHQKERENLLKRLRVKYRNGIDMPLPYEKIGIILYNPLGEMWIANGAKLLGNGTLPSYSPTKEAFIKYSVWKYFKNMNYIVATECELPRAVGFEARNIKRKTREVGGARLPPGMYVNGYVSTTVHTGHNTIDITAMPRSNLNETDPSKLEITGIECKAAINKDKLSKQLESYLKSGDLSELYLAIPQELEYRANKLLTQRYLDEKEDLTSVGILSVGANGEVEEIKEAKKLEMKNPSFFEIEKRKVEDGRFRERIYTERTLEQ
jgi:hypothetical protein